MSETRVQDWRGKEIKLGTVVVFGAPDTPEEIAAQTGKVTEIGEPDVLYNPVTDTDDGGYALDLIVTFSDGTTETVQANFASPRWYDDEPELFEANGDIEVAENA